MSKTIIALPKGRILEEAEPFLSKAGIFPEEAFFDSKSRLLRFKTKDPDVELIRVRSFDVATFVAFGAAQLGICGNDVLTEFDYPEIYAPIDLGIGKCRMSAAGVGTNIPGIIPVPFRKLIFVYFSGLQV